MDVSEVQWALFKSLSRARLGKLAADLYFKTAGSDSLPPIDDSITQYDHEPATEGNVLIPIVQGESNQSYRLCILAHAFRQRGYQPLVPLCEASIPICFRRDTGKDHDAICDKCETWGKKMLESFNLDYLTIEPTISDGVDHELGADPGKELTYRDIPISQYALASTRRFVKKHRIDLDDEYEQTIYRRCLSAAKTLVDTAERVIDSHNVDAIVAGDPSYLYGGLFLKVGEKHDIPAKSLGYGYYRDQTVMLGDQLNRSPLQFYTDFDVVEEHLAEELTDAERDEVDRYMERRFAGEFDGASFVKDIGGELESDYDRVVGLFSNLLWDTALEAGKLAAFDDPFGWFDETIEQFWDRDDTNLVIKTHPAEGHRVSNESVYDWIHASYPDLPNHITILPPKTEVSPYKMMSYLDRGIVWNSTIGLEMAYQGIPTIVVGDAHYKDHGFTFDAMDRETYRDLLDDSLSVDETMESRAKRYCHLLFFKKQFDFPFYTKDETGVELLPVHADDLAPGNEEIDAILESILTGNPAIK
jgi:hypothetical protein